MVVFKVPRNPFQRWFQTVNAQHLITNDKHRHWRPNADDVAKIVFQTYPDLRHRSTRIC